ncbi:MAG TPA: hypothetical protein VIH40_05330 [Xanthobacteraceae bacterium]
MKNLLPLSVTPPPLAVLAGAGALLFGLALALWVHYGTAVFYEMILAGIAWCL